MVDVDATETTLKDELEPLRRAPQHIRKIIKRILTLESERLYQRQPHLNEDVIRIIKEEVK